MLYFSYNADFSDFFVKNNKFIVTYHMFLRNKITIEKVHIFYNPKGDIMGKKFLVTLTILLCILCCAIGLVACNDGNDEHDQSNERAITKAEWESSINSKAFDITLLPELWDKAQVGVLQGLKCWKNGYMADFMGKKSDQYWIPSDKDAVWIKKNGNYFTFNEEDYFNDGFQMTATTEQAYNETLSPYVQLLEYVKSNYEKFTHDGGAREMAYTYTPDIANMKAECTAATQLGLTDVRVVKQLSVQNDTLGDVQMYLDVDDISYKVTFKPMVISYVKDTAFNSLTNYTLKAGPSATDADYGEYYLNENGFRMYTPNNANPNRHDGYYKYNATTDDYTHYTKQADGSFITETVGKNALQTVLNGVIDAYMYFATEKNTTAYATADGLKFKDVTKTVGQREHRYFDIEITLDENGGIASATWKYQMTQGEQSTQVYFMELTAGNTVINFPNV